jgi:hypothetical protein
MAEDFIELAFEAFDTGVDKGFHKVPDKALQNPFRRKSKKDSREPPKSSRDEYDDGRDPSPTSASDEPRSRNKSTRQRRDQSPGYDDTGYYSDSRRGSGRTGNQDRERRSKRGGEDRDDRPRSGGDADDRSRSGGVGENNGAGYYESPYYTPQTGMLAYASPAATYDTPYEPRARYPAPQFSDEPAPYADPYTLYKENAKGGNRDRRSHSQHGSSDRSRRPGLKQRSSSYDGGSAAGLKKVFSDSGRGLGAGAIGAVAGGFLAQEAAMRNKKGKGKGMSDPIVLTLLGAVVGGLGANALEKGYDKKEKRDRDRDRY